jgi:hypothetical protein
VKETVRSVAMLVGTKKAIAKNHRIPTLADLTITHLLSAEYPDELRRPRLLACADFVSCI